MRWIIQALALAAVGALACWPFVSIPQVAGAPRAPWPEPTPLSVDGVLGPVQIRTVGGFRPLTAGMPLRLPAQVRGGALRLRQGDGVWWLDEGPDAVLVGRGPKLGRIVLRAGRLRVGGSGAVVVAAGARQVTGRSFGLWAREDGGFDLVALAETRVSGLEEPLKAGEGATWVGDRLERASLSDPLEVTSSRPDRRFGALEFRTSPLARLELTGPAGRRRSRGEDGIFRAFVSRRDAVVFEDPAGRRAGLTFEGQDTWSAAKARLNGPMEPAPVPTAAEAPPASAEAAATSPSREPEGDAPVANRPEKQETALSGPRGARDRGGQPGSDGSAPPQSESEERPRSAESDPSAEAAESQKESRETPEPLEVDWTQLGRPRGRVGAEEKPEKPAPPVPEKKEEDEF